MRLKGVPIKAADPDFEKLWQGTENAQLAKKRKGSSSTSSSQVSDTTKGGFAPYEPHHPGTYHGFVCLPENAAGSAGPHLQLTMAALGGLGLTVFACAPGPQSQLVQVPFAMQNFQAAFPGANYMNMGMGMAGLAPPPIIPPPPSAMAPPSLPTPALQPSKPPPKPPAAKPPAAPTAVTKAAAADAGPAVAANGAAAPGAPPPAPGTAPSMVTVRHLNKDFHISTQPAYQSSEAPAKLLIDNSFSVQTLVRTGVLPEAGSVPEIMLGKIFRCPACRTGKRGPCGTTESCNKCWRRVHGWKERDEDKMCPNIGAFVSRRLFYSLRGLQDPREIE